MALVFQDSSSLYFYLVRADGQISGLTGYDQAANKKQLMDHFRTFAPSVPKMLDKTPKDSVKLWDLLDMELQPSLINKRALLIGDAAHPFLPRKSHHLMRATSSKRT